MSEQEDLISQFKDVTGTTSDRARFYLESANWTLQLAISSFYESGGEIEIEDLGHQEISDDLELDSRSNSPPPLASSESNSNTKKMSKSSNSDSSFKRSTNKPRIATLHNMSQRSSDDEEEGQAFYAGGSERSGQQVLGPPKRKNFREQLTDMIRSAHDSGAVVDPMTQPPSSSSSTRSDIYQGVGLKLGQTDTDHEVVTNQRPSRPQNIEPVILKLWSQGFSVNDGELRPYDDPDNKEFLETVMRGQIPHELREMGNVVSVDLEDHRHEDYKKPATAVKTFKGSGHTLGSPAPNVEPSLPAVPSGNPAENEKRAAEQLKVNREAPTTMLQIRLADGTRLSGQFNHSHTIDDIRQYIVTARPQYENQTFILVTSFPTKELNDGVQTIEQAGLLNASLMQRVK